MARSSGKGSILYKILIVVLIGALIAVIKIPDSIWEEEALEQEQSRYNMSSIYEAEKYFSRLTGSFTTDIDTLLQVVKNDSAIHQNQKIVDYTIQLMNQIDNYLSIPTIDGFVKVYQNIDNIKDDLEANERYFRADESILNEASELRLQLSEFENDVAYPNLAVAVHSLDSLHQLRRDLSDYNLQTAASRAKDNVTHLNPYLPSVNWTNFESEWTTLDNRLAAFNDRVDNSEVSQFTSVADRIKDFAADVTSGLQTIKKANSTEDLSRAEELRESLEKTYQQFLADFIVTSRSAMYRLSESDSMILTLTKEKFSSPVSGKLYLIEIDEDGKDVKVESPLLLDDLKEKVKPVVDEVTGFGFLNAFFTYHDTLEAIYQKGLDIKGELRRNIEITVKNKEIEEKINKFLQSSEYTAAADLRNFVNVYNNSNSFSELEKAVENARNSIIIFEQLYGGNLFDNIDSLHTGIQNDLTDFNGLLADLRRLPRGVEPFDAEKEQLETLLADIKQPSGAVSTEKFKSLQAQLEDAFRFAEEGKKITVMGVFKKTIQNMGYVHKNTKSWEEKENNQ